MSDELVAAPNAGEVAKARPHVEIQKRVSATLATSGPQLLKAVETALVDVQQERRKNAVLKAIEKISAEDKELVKLLAQGVQSYNAANEPVGPPVFSKQQMQAIKEKREAIQKMENALNMAIGEKLDFQKLYELTGDGK